MLYCPVYFALKDLRLAYSLSSIHAKGAYVGPRRGKIGDGNSRVEGNTLAQLGRGRQTFKRAYCCSFHSGFDCLCFDLVWGVHVAQCYPPIISAISKTLQWKRHWLGFSVSAVVRPIFFTPHSKHESPCIWIQKKWTKAVWGNSEFIQKTPTWFMVSRKKIIHFFVVKYTSMTLAMWPGPSCRTLHLRLPHAYPVSLMNQPCT